MTKYSQQTDDKLLEGILDHMAQENHGEFGFETLDAEDRLKVIALFVDNPTSWETSYLHSIETEDTEVISSKDKTNVEILKDLIDYTRFPGYDG
tara:strand:+ start:478 stop:759 length:282 start_codon:yes stop_codon:yes gene_type:complete